MSSYGRRRVAGGEPGAVRGDTMGRRDGTTDAQGPIILPARVTRRQVLKAGLAAGAAGFAWPLARPAAVAAEAGAMGAIPAFVAYHDRSHADHQQQFNTWYNLGYRMISLSVYGVPPQPLYAAVWVKRDGPPWAAIHGATAAQYQAFFDAWAAKGFHPTILTVAGPAANPLFAGVCEQRPGPIPLTRFGLVSGDAGDSNTIQHWNAQAREKGWVPGWLAIYGDAASPRYAGIWQPNASKVFWNADGINDSAADYQQWVNAQGMQGGRPAFTTLSAAGRYLSVFQNDQIGPWVARHGLTSEGYQAECNMWVGQGYYPIRVQGGGAGAERRFAALFATGEAAVPRQLTVTGVAVPALAAFDTAVQDYMRAYGVRAVSLAVVKDKRLVLARGYTWAEPGYPITQPTSLFRIASCSKPLTSIAVHQLIEQGALSLDTPLRPTLGLQPPPGKSLDPDHDKVQV